MIMSKLHASIRETVKKNQQNWRKHEDGQGQLVFLGFIVVVVVPLMKTIRNIFDLKSKHAFMLVV